jgi:uncharacterized protein YndB with AHSA1/START domain
MTPRPTGRLERTAQGAELLLTRSFKASIDDVWASITEPERTARWFASWTGDAGPGKTIRYKMLFEDGASEADLTIDACEPPHRLAVSMYDEGGAWRMEARLTEEGGVTTLTLVHHVGDHLDALGSIGPGWEYYLDMLVASREDQPLPAFDDYYPSQKPYYDTLP